MDLISMELFNYIYMFVAYIICIVFLYRANTEYLCFVLFMVLHIFTLTLFVASGIGKGMGNMITFIPFTIFIWNGQIPISVVFIIGWICLLVANTNLINTYRGLHTVFGTVGKPIDLGDPKNYELKDNLKISMIICTILLWSLFTFNNIDLLSPKSKNKILICVSIGTLFLSSLSVYFSQQLSNNTMTITTLSN